MKSLGDGNMKYGINLSKGLFFNNELELERAMMILMENGFTPDQNMGTFTISKLPYRLKTNV